MAGGSEAVGFSHKRWEELVQDTVKQIQYLGKVKGGEYAGDTDRLENFRRNALAAGVSMPVVWRIYAGKHWDAITQWVKDIQEGKQRERAESMLGRFDDLIVYAILGKAIYLELTENQPPEVPTPKFNRTLQPWLPTLNIVSYAECEGGKWLPWDKEHKISEDMLKVLQAELRDRDFAWYLGTGVHALRFDDGAEWDIRNGWRKQR